MTGLELGFVVLILGLSRGALWVSARAWEGERGRKLMHVLMGCLLTPLPWVFEGVWAVEVLCAIYVVLLLGRRWIAGLDREAGRVIYSVGRRSFGEYLFPVVVGILFWGCGRERGVWLACMMTLTFADSAAAVVGKRWGMCRYRTVGGSKSLEGSLAFCAVAFGCVYVGLWDGGARVTAGMIAVAVAVGLTFLEAGCARGFDNLLVPLAGWGLIVVLRGLGVGTQAGVAAVAVMAGMGVVILYAVFGRPDAGVVVRGRN